MNVTANATTSATTSATGLYQQPGDLLELLDRMQDFDGLMAELLEESEKAFEEGRLGFCALMDSMVIPGIAAESDQARAALESVYGES